MIMKMKNSRRKFLKRLGAMAGAALIPGLATEDVLAIPITSSGGPTKKKAAPKKKAATKKKVATKKKAAPKKKVVAKKKVATKKKIVARNDLPYTPYDPPYTPPPVGVPEPSTFGLVSIGVAAVALATQHKKNGQEGKG